MRIASRASVYPAELLGSSPAVTKAAAAAELAARRRDPVLIVAERGLSSERVARFIHASASAPFEALDCGAGTADTIVRDLFGQASARRTDLEGFAARSRLARARGGTLFLANLAQLPAGVQLRLARLLRDGEARLGAKTIRFDVRVIGAAYPGLEIEVADRRFRPELFERLQRSRVDLPSLRDRPGDMPAIIAAVLDEVCSARRASRTLAPAAFTALAALPWAGNIDELRLVLDRLVTKVGSGAIRQEDVLADLRPGAPAARRYAALGSLREARLSFEREYIAAVLREHGWRMSDAARTLGIQRANLYRKTRQLGISRLKPSRVS